MQKIQILTFDAFVRQESFIELLSEAYDLRIVGIPEIIRKEMRMGSNLGLKIKGHFEKEELLPIELLNAIFKKNILIDDKDILVIRYPRTENQYNGLMKLLEGLNLKVDKVWHLKLENPEYVFRKNAQKIIDANPHEYESTKEKFLEMLRLKQEEYGKVIDQWSVEHQVSVVKVDYEKEKDLLRYFKEEIKNA